MGPEIIFQILLLKTNSKDFVRCFVLAQPTVRGENGSLFLCLFEARSLAMVTQNGQTCNIKIIIITITSWPVIFCIKNRFKVAL